MKLIFIKNKEGKPKIANDLKVPPLDNEYTTSTLIKRMSTTSTSDQVTDLKHELWTFVTFTYDVQKHPFFDALKSYFIFQQNKQNNYAQQFWQSQIYSWSATNKTDDTAILWGRNWPS